MPERHRHAPGTCDLREGEKSVLHHSTRIEQMCATSTDTQMKRTIISM
jgi:hypothetical protein